jgi:hypothetical protein
MAKTPKLVSSDTYESIAMAFQHLDADRLNRILKEHGIKKKDVRQAICEDYAFESGVFYDQGWFEVDGKSYYPSICFAERLPQTDEGFGAVTALHWTDGGYPYEEMAIGIAAQLFEDLKENSNVKWFPQDSDEEGANDDE